MAQPVEPTEQWSSRLGFILAAIGFAVGLGNIWRFPYIAGEHGGGAFLFIYVACAFAIGLPLLITELTIGRRGRASASGSIRAVAAESGASRRWGGVGGLAVLCVFIILSYYSVLTGWTFDYLLRALAGSFEGISSGEAESMFAALMADPLRLLFWNTVVHGVVYLVVRQGVQAGVERACKILMPALFAALVVMCVYGAVAGDMVTAARFLIEPDFSRVSVRTVLVATGQAFFSIGIGMGTLITFGAYLPKDFSIARSAAVIIVADTGIALLAGFAIFPLVFGFGLAPSSGPGLIFQTLPLAFGHMPAGVLFGAIFFLLLIAAALSSCIGCSEAVVAWVDQHWGIRRANGMLLTVAGAWLLGVLTILSFGDWSDFYPLDFIPAFARKTIFESLDFLAANILLLLGGALTALFFGWFVPKRLKLEEMGVSDGAFFGFWRFMIRIVIPLLLILMLVMGMAQ
jgi:neurotransmitter:Na+ symporter, NSS family